MKKTLPVLLGTLLTLTTVTTAMAAPQPPTNAGQGAGQSGQCAGPIAERPASCQATLKGP